MIYPWQQKQYVNLVSAFKQGQLPHAMLLVGNQGMGKLDFANEFSKFLLCENTALQSSCGECRSCTMFEAESHPDFFTVTLLDKSKVIKIDQVRDIIERLSKTSQIGKKVVIIHPADKMNVASANAPLKTLEEPPGDVLIMLITSIPAKLPATVVSRCQRINFTSQDRQGMIDWLSENGNQDADLLLRHSFDSPLMVDALASQNYLPLRDELVDMLGRACLSGENILPAIPALLKQDVQMIMRALLSLASDLIKIRMQASTDYLINIDMFDRLQRIAFKFDASGLYRIHGSLVEARQQLDSGTHVNVQLLFESLFLMWMSGGVGV